MCTKNVNVSNRCTKDTVYRDFLHLIDGLPCNCHEQVILAYAHQLTIVSMASSSCSRLLWHWQAYICCASLQALEPLNSSQGLTALQSRLITRFFPKLKKHVATDTVGFAVVFCFAEYDVQGQRRGDWKTLRMPLFALSGTGRGGRSAERGVSHSGTVLYAI